MSEILSKIRLPHSTVPGAIPGASFLDIGELAINIADGKIYYKDDGGVIKEFTFNFNAIFNNPNANFKLNENGDLMIRETAPVAGWRKIWLVNGVLNAGPLVQ